jgi:AcrR family transcriptional regulator
MRFVDKPRRERSLAIRPVTGYHGLPMPRETVADPRQEILRTSARLFRQQGYDATSMNDISAALKLSKGGLYHHFRSKDEILFHIMNHAMDLTEELVVAQVRDMADPEERLRALIRCHIQLVLRARDREITVILHENHPLPAGLRKRVNARKKEYIQSSACAIAGTSAPAPQRSPCSA